MPRGMPEGPERTGGAIVACRPEPVGPGSAPPRAPKKNLPRRAGRAATGADAAARLPGNRFSHQHLGRRAAEKRGFAGPGF